MFHLRFYKPETLDNVNIQGRRYDSDYINDMQRVTVYDKFTSDGGGVEFWVGRDFTECFVTNEAGKTIDRIGPMNINMPDPEPQ